ncbi:acyltransferase family protein [Endozoicomonas gorgoniicola]|uniref:Acyltransferase family protein n=1 Tax=Endozoicomonas gorgoniicola TaxID=1234144 RepID=A0ABT3MPT2_9GAMM|nr:acyltransferase family protein [Endozoicomonas gorgoniicola]MCW7551381.1 acyltransferase family protein [Endozoicomonas gorgoniicola]
MLLANSHTDLGKELIMKKRMYWLDNAKSIGIFLVVLGHLSIPSKLHNYIYAFHMPLFFFLSGVTFKHKNFELKEFMLKRARVLLFPYLVFGIATYLWWLAIGRNFGSGASTIMPLYRPLVGMLYSNGIDGWLIHNVPLWFLTCLFITECIFFSISKTVSKKTLLIIISLIAYFGYLLSSTNAPRLPWGINIVPMSQLFLCAGYLLKEFAGKNSLGRLPNSMITIATLALTYWLSYKNWGADMNHNHYGNLVIYVIAAIAGIIAIISFSKIIPPNSIMSYIGKNTLTILVLHGFVCTLLKGIFIFLLNFPLSEFNETLLLNLIIAVGSILALFPVAFFFGKKSTLSYR